MKIIKQMMLATSFFVLITPIASAQGIPQVTNPGEVGLSLFMERENDYPCSANMAAVISFTCAAASVFSGSFLPVKPASLI